MGGSRGRGVFSTGHLTSGVAVGLALGLDGAALGAFVGASVLTDWDYVFQIRTGRNHRTLLSHSPPVVAALLAPLGLVHPLFWALLGGAMLHLALDATDSGVRLNPFSRDLVGLRLLDVAPDAPFGVYLRAYFRDRRFLGAEVAFALLAGVALALRWPLA